MKYCKCWLCEVRCLKNNETNEKYELARGKNNRKPWNWWTTKPIKRFLLIKGSKENFGESSWYWTARYLGAFECPEAKKWWRSWALSSRSGRASVCLCRRLRRCHSIDSWTGPAWILATSTYLEKKNSTSVCLKNLLMWFVWPYLVLYMVSTVVASYDWVVQIMLLNWFALWFPWLFRGLLVPDA